MSEGNTQLPTSDPVSLLQLVMDNIPQFIFWKNRESVYLGCNENFARAAGVSCPSDIVGKTDHELAWKTDEADFFRAVDRRVMESGVAEHNIIEPQLQADGRQAWLRTNKIPLLDADGRVVGILGTFEDITDERVKEERLRYAQKMESIGQLAGGVAHDFNNMLSGILGASELLARHVDDSARGAELLRIVAHSAERAADLTRKLLAFSRRGQMDRRPMDIHTVIRDAVTILARSIDRRISIDVELDAAETSVVGDASELESAILNLCINARDAIEGHGRIRISTRGVVIGAEEAPRGAFPLAPGRYIEIELSDTGHGIPDEHISLIFEPFFTTKDVGSGTGLGLAAVYGAITEHDGAVTVEGRPGQGASFTILLPVSEAQPSPESAAKSARAAARPRHRLLVIDDEAGVRTVLQHMLEDLGYVVTLAVDGVDGLAVFRADPDAFDAVLLDVVMPRMGGGECLVELRAIRPNVRVLMSSGFTRDMTIEGLAEHAVGGFLKKPYSRDELGEAVFKLLREA